MTVQEMISHPLTSDEQPNSRTAKLSNSLTA